MKLLMKVPSARQSLLYLIRLQNGFFLPKLQHNNANPNLVRGRPRFFLIFIVTEKRAPSWIISRPGPKCAPLDSRENESRSPLPMLRFLPTQPVKVGTVKRDKTRRRSRGVKGNERDCYTRNVDLSLYAKIGFPCILWCLLHPLYFI